jgi:hypothetical protein
MDTSRSWNGAPRLSSNARTPLQSSNVRRMPHSVVVYSTTPAPPSPPAAKNPSSGVRRGRAPVVHQLPRVQGVPHVEEGRVVGQRVAAVALVRQLGRGARAVARHREWRRLQRTQDVCLMFYYIIVLGHWINLPPFKADV